MFFDTPNEKESTFEPLPNGTYRVMVVGSEMRHHKDGSSLGVKFQVLGGEQDKRILFYNFPYANQNTARQKIGHSQMKKLLTAVGVTQAIAYENEFHRLIADKVLVIDFAREPGKNGGETLYDRIKEFKPDGEVAATAAVPF